MNELIEKFVNSELHINMRHATKNDWGKLQNLIPDLRWASGHSLFDYQPRCSHITGFIRKNKTYNNSKYLCTYATLSGDYPTGISIPIGEFLELSKEENFKFSIEENELLKLLSE